MKAEEETLVPRLSPLLVAGDLACFVVFGLLGLRSHDEGVTLANFSRAVVPFSVAWLVTATAFGVMRPESASSSAERMVAAWLPAWAAGLVARILIFGRPFAAGFAIVSLLVPVLFLLGWRHAFVSLRERHRVQACC